jgi:hypothetical protein
MDQSNRLLIAGVVLFGSAVIARRYQSDGIGISPDDLPEEGEVRRSSWKSKARGDATYAETVVVTGRRGSASRSPITKTMFDKDPELPLDEQRRLAKERAERFEKEAREAEVVVNTSGVKIALPNEKLVLIGSDEARRLINFKLRDTESKFSMPLTPSEKRILTINTERFQDWRNQKRETKKSVRRFEVSREEMKSSCMKRVPMMVRIRKLLDSPELLDEVVYANLKTRWTNFQGQCIDNVPEVMNRYLHFSPR